MKRLLQNDPQWAKITIGNTNLELEDWGCTITCISMASDYFGKYRNPGWLAKNLKFTPAGLLYWSSVSEVLNFKAWRVLGRNDNEIDKALKDDNKMAILEVPYGRNKHWVVATKKAQNGHYYIADPLNRNPLRTTKSFGRYTGYTILTRTEPAEIKDEIKDMDILQSLNLAIQYFKNIYDEKDNNQKKVLAHEGAEVIRYILKLIGDAS